MEAGWPWGRVNPLAREARIFARGQTPGGRDGADLSRAEGGLVGRDLWGERCERGMMKVMDDVWGWCLALWGSDGMIVGIFKLDWLKEIG
ncbi:hypothetical protein KM043_006754 [Ampulex compressa]|nr:hypothetical protein KM043_006754 [Ampulex compressa]